MAIKEEKLREYAKRLMLSKMRILATHGFYGLLLTHMPLNIDESCETAATDGLKIYFDPKFLDNLNDSELDFIMMHEIMHVVLQHCLRDGDRDPIGFNIACDIVVNSNILYSWGGNVGKITLRKYGESMHLAPDGKEGYNYTAEEVYEMMLQKAQSHGGGKKKGKKDKKGKSLGGEVASSASEMEGSLANVGNPIDCHDRWGKLTEEEKELVRDKWQKHVEDATTVISILKDTASDGSGPPIGALRLLEAKKSSQVDWREILNNFISTEINDYSFSPPDRRFSDSDFFLPDFNEKDEKVGNIWFLIDTSGSISDKAINAAFAEISSAIEQFNGKLDGYLSFTEVFVTDPVPFSSVEDLMKIKPMGGGGNDFSEIFRYMKKNMMDNLPSQIIIITDGYDTYPNEEDAMGVPVLWLLNNEQAAPPKWGKVARISTQFLE